MVEYDKLVLAPGIDFKWEEIEGYDEAAAEVMPHAYKAGPQTQLLKEKVDNMAEGGTFVMVAPPNPFRCPPGPYERVCMIAKRFKESNPSAKIVILDAKAKHSKQALFQEGLGELLRRHGRVGAWRLRRQGHRGRRRGQ